MNLKLKNLLSFIYYIPLSFQNNVYANNKNKIDDFGIISLMYHRFEENKYPSTNIK